MKPERIRVFVTGGTFDKEYDEINGRLYFKDTHLGEMLKLARCSLEVEIRTLMMIDSLEMKDTDRELILRNCEKCDENRIVVTHGTDTLAQSARVLGSAFAGSATLKKKTVVLTGAMIPFKFGSSDGLFNLGAALGFAQALPSGVYVAMNGQCFNWDNVEKDRNSGRFKTLR